MGLMNAIGLQPRNPTTSVTSQGTQTLAPQLQNAETQTEREVQDPESAASGAIEGKSVGLKAFSTQINHAIHLTERITCTVIFLQ